MTLKVIFLVCCLFPFSLTHAHTPPPTAPRFKLVILAGDFMSLRLGYPWEQSWPLLQRADLDSPLATLSEDDLAQVDWERQVFTLSEAALAQMIAQFDLPTGEQGDWRISHALYQQAFILLLDDAPLYGGIILPMISAMGIQYPVLGLDSQDPQAVTLRFLPYQGGLEDFSQGRRFANDDSRAMIEAPRLKAFLAKQDLLTDDLNE
jgi:hypothetical protein